ncbi:MAG: DUF192 domain-containing protein [Candidatus Micrarchaeaceae archaeon]
MHFLQKRQVYKRVRIRIGNDELVAELSDTFVKRMIGLMYRDGLEKGLCMLFDFHSKGRYGIWMHNMRFPIDVLWIGEDMQIVDTLAFAKRCGSLLRCRTYRPSSPARYVIELPAGYIDEKGVAAGMSISIYKKP